MIRIFAHLKWLQTAMCVDIYGRSFVNLVFDLHNVGQNSKPTIQKYFSQISSTRDYVKGNTQIQVFFNSLAGHYQG